MSAASMETPCPDCGSPVRRLTAINRPKACDACARARRIASRKKWADANADVAAALIRAYKDANREKIRSAARKDVQGTGLVCAVCHAAFTRAGTRGPIPKWCPECKAQQLLTIAAVWRSRHPEKVLDLGRRSGARRRAVQRGAVETVERAVVFARDGWTCKLCDQEVPREAAHPDPLSASLDHIRPLSLGGTHTYANVQLAHLRCNLVKGNRVRGAA